MKQGKRIVGGVVGTVAVIGVTSAGIQLWNVHRMTSDWMLWPKAVPSKVQFADRDYQCGPNPVPNTHSLEGLTKQGRTAGGADIYAADQGAQNSTVTWIVIATGPATYACDLMGGP
ncbi:hypothetical protein [Sinomonas humi]|uniref:hypothetical protein n=1 Tax=Sinomonas humi TaxID=1338436 RepID=UPI000691AD90|nr:hypothetical protein [Sinomonas humi]